MWKTKLNIWASIACVGAILNVLVYFAHAQCTNGCLESNCLKAYGQCYQASQTQCISNYDGNPKYGAVGGVVKNEDPPVQMTWYLVPSCSKECSATYSRALNSQRMSTCSGKQTSPANQDLCYCASPSS